MLPTRRFGVMKSRQPPFLHCGLEIARNSAGAITAHQQTHLRRLQPIPLYNGLSDQDLTTYELVLSPSSGPFVTDCARVARGLGVGGGRIDGDC